MLHFESLRQTDLSANVLKSFFNAWGVFTGFSGACLEDLRNQAAHLLSLMQALSPQMNFIASRDFTQGANMHMFDTRTDSLSNSWSSRVVYSVFLILIHFSRSCRNVEFWFQAPRAFGIKKKTDAQLYANQI